MRIDKEVGNVYFLQGFETTEMLCTYITTVDTTVKYPLAQKGIQTITRG